MGKNKSEFINCDEELKSSEIGIRDLAKFTIEAEKKRIKKINKIPKKKVNVILV